jgi:hypothetical protein
MAYLIDRIQKQLMQTGLEPRSTAARTWLRKKASDLSPSRTSLLSDKDRQVTTPFIGHMYFYFYDPKTKDYMQYYDKFPLVIPIEMYRDGFLGLNLHYIHPKQRIILLDKLAEYATDKRFDIRTRLRLSYDLLRRASKAFEATPCIKRYLFSHVQSRMVEIFADEWDIAALLPAENFVGASTSKVWSDSRKKF